MTIRLACGFTAAALGAIGVASSVGPTRVVARAGASFRVGHVVDGDTVELRNGARVRLVQIDTPEVYFHRECYGRQASAATKRLLPHGARVRLMPERATDLR